MRPAVAIWILGLVIPAAIACAIDEPEPDPLDPTLVRELSMGQGSATGDARSGTWSFEFEAEFCDCPSFEIEGQEQDLCAIASFVSVELELLEGSGVLAIPAGPDAQLGVLTGAIETDDSFSVASRHDAATVVGPLEVLRRLDGRFEDGDTRAEGWAGQRLIGEVAGDGIDCRWTGSFAASRL